jgi:hypothetical protein
MSDGLPSDEQLRRIERGVQRRIDLRRRLAQRIAGGGVAVLLVVGGFALLRPTMGTSAGAGSTSGRFSGADSGGAAAPAEALQAVRCHGAVATTVSVDPARLPTSALIACAAAERRQVAAATDGGDVATPRPSASGAVLCRAADGALSVWAGSSCTVHGLQPYAG